MRFGSIAVAGAAGATLAHSINVDGKRLSKGTILDAETLRRLERAGIAEVIAARRDDGDLSEDEAAAMLAAPLAIPDFDVGGAATGRVNIHARTSGILSISAESINRFNRIDPALTIATLPDRMTVRQGQMVATVKIIPFFVSRSAVEKAAAVLSDASPAIGLRPFRQVRAALIQTVVSGTSEKMLQKTAAITAARFARTGNRVAREMRVPHDRDELTQALKRLQQDHDLLIVFGASAVCDFDDVIPAAIRQAGGEVERVGMPVDPGNLLVLGSLNGKPVIGAPGCARSLKENGFDWVLNRVLTGDEIASSEIAAMGVGGLLQEIETRPRPREAGMSAVPVAAVILAAGTSRRMGAANKLLAVFDGETAVRRAARRAVASDVSGTVLVTGDNADKIRAEVADLPLRIEHNPEYTEGMASSLRKGLEAMPADHGVLVLLGDMPEITTGHIDEMIAEFQRHGGTAVIRAASRGDAGNPVILPPGIVNDAVHLSGDIGARHLIEASGAPVHLVEIGDAAFIDIDTPQALAAAGGHLPE